MLGVVASDLGPRLERAGEHEPDPSLLEHVRDVITDARLETLVGDLGESVCAGQKIPRVQRIADPQLDVVDAVQRHEVVVGTRRRVGELLLRSHVCLLDQGAAALARSAIAAIDSSVQVLKKPPTTSMVSSTDSAR